MDRIVHWVRVDSSGTGAVVLEGTPRLASLAAPMIMLNLVTEYQSVFGKECYADQAPWAVEELFKHVQVSYSCKYTP
jgi:hypothetical protein